MARYVHKKFDDCKGPLHHDFDLIEVRRKTRGMIGTPVLYRCMRCGTEKIESYDIQGNLMTRKYFYPEGYREEGRDNIRLYRLRLLSKYRSTHEPKEI